MKKQYELEDLLTVKVKKLKDKYRLEGSFGPRYQEVFGNKFHNVWINLEEPEPIFFIQFKKDLEGNEEFFEGKGDIFLSHFYFNPSKYRENDMGGDKYWLLLSTQERAFFKGMGFKLLCYLLSTMFNDKFLKPEHYIILDASGGNSAKDMEQLVKYYQKLSFKPYTNDQKVLKDGYENFDVPMITLASKLYNKCQNK